MPSPVSSTICGTRGVWKNAKPYSETSTGTFGTNGLHWQTKPYSVRRNGSLPNYRKLLVERAVTLYDGRAFRKEPDDSDIYVCEVCGSMQIEVTAWVDANTGEYISDAGDDCTGEWCDECKEHHGHCTLMDFKQEMQDWWNSCDIKLIELITGLKACDYPPSKSPQAFVDVAGQWWNSRDYECKRKIYNEYNFNNE